MTPSYNPSKKLPTLSGFAAGVTIVFLIYAFFSGLTTEFYASFLFYFYSFTKSMWVSVLLIGLFQTLLMVPFRIIRVILSTNIKNFQQNIQKSQLVNKTGLLKTQLSGGSTTFAFYSVDFVMQFVSYTSMIRFFLKDFYNTKLNPDLLYDWVKYPAYPLENRFFKIPYPVVLNTIAIHWGWLIFACLLVVAVFIASHATYRSVLVKKGKEAADYMFRGRFQLLTNSSLIITLLILFLLMRNWPNEWTVRIFTGDISIPNRTFNTVTAWVTFFTLLWHNIPVIVRKGRLAKNLGVPQNIVEKTQLRMFKETLITSGLVGLGAFFITNQIPSAFELSIFTLEIISLFSPLTLDRWILKNIEVPKNELEKRDLPDEMQEGVEEKAKE